MQGGEAMRHGTLTVEQVRDIIERHSMWTIGNNRCFYNGAYDDIADELNARMGPIMTIPDPMTASVRIVKKWRDNGDGTFTAEWRDITEKLCCPNCGEDVFVNDEA
jgi:hypothetical protein